MAVDITKLPQLTQGAIAAMDGFLARHVREVGTSNTGKDVDRFLRTAGASPGDPWCAACVYTAWDDAAKALGVTNPLPKTAYCPDVWQFAKSRGILTNRPAVGASMLQFHGSEPHHTGMVRELLNVDTFHDIEGNTNTDGAREGWEVALQTRYVDPSRYVFADWNKLLAPPVANRNIIMGGGRVLEAPVVNGRTLVPVRAFVQLCNQYFSANAVLGWNANAEPPITINHEPLQAELSLINGSAYAPIRTVLSHIPALAPLFDEANGNVTVQRTIVPSAGK